MIYKLGILNFFLLTAFSSKLSEAKDIAILNMDPLISRNISKELTKSNCDPYRDTDSCGNIGYRTLLKHLDYRFVEVIKSLSSITGPSVIMVKNFPVDEEIPPTPRNGNRPPSIFSTKTKYSKAFVSETALLGLGKILETQPVFEHDEKDGTCINQLIPKEGDEYIRQQSSFGSKTAFGLHTENVYQDPPLKYFALLGLRGDPKVFTRVVFVNDLFKAIEVKLGDRYQDFTRIISIPQFIMRTGPSFENSIKQIVRPIVETMPTKEILFRYNVNNDRVLPTNSESLEAKTILDSILTDSEFIENNSVKVVIQKGDLLLFNNWRVMHGRDGFELDKSNWRWIQRVYFQ